MSKRKALEKALKEHFSKEEIEELEWFVDEESDEFYIWRFQHPREKKIRKLIYDKARKKVFMQVVKRVSGGPK